MVSGQFLAACQRYLDYVKEVERPKMVPQGEVQALDKVVMNGDVPAPKL